MLGVDGEELEVGLEGFVEAFAATQVVGTPREGQEVSAVDPSLELSRASGSVGFWADGTCELEGLFVLAGAKEVGGFGELGACLFLEADLVELCLEGFARFFVRGIEDRVAQ